MFLIDHDEPQARHGGKQRQPRTQQDVGLTAGNAQPCAETLAFGEPAVHDGEGVRRWRPVGGGCPVRGMVFDASATAIAACAGGLAFRLAGGETGSLRLLDDLIAVVALGLAYLTVRTLLLDVVRRHETFDPRLVVSAGEVGLGATLALLAIGHPWNVVLLVPVAIAVQ